MFFKNQRYNRMKILQITGMHSTKFGGLERYFLEMAKVIHRRGDVLYIAYNIKPKSEDYKAELKKYNAEIIVSDFDGISTFKMAVNLIRIIKQIKPQIVHFHFGKASRNCFFIPKLMGCKIYKTIHSMVTFKPKTKWLSEIRYKLMLKYYNNTLTVSNAIKESIIHIAGKNSDKILVRYIGTDIETGNNTNADNSKANKIINICCIAFHNHIKGIDVLISALHILKTKHNYNNFKLIEIGGDNDEYKRQLEALVNKLGLNEEVTFYGLCNNVPQALIQMDIYVQPSRNEGIGLALMEASAQKLPLVGSNIGGIPEIIEDGVNGFLFPVEDIEKLAEILYNLCTDPNLRKEVGERSYKSLKEKFDLKKNVEEQIQEFYN